MKRGQISIEYLILLGLFFMLLIPILYYSIDMANSNLKINQANDAIETLAKAADTVYSLGSGNKEFVSIYIPKGVKDVSATNNEILLRLSIFGGTSDFHASTKANLIQGPYFQNLKNKGNHRVAVEFLDSGEVRIG